MLADIEQGSRNKIENLLKIFKNSSGFSEIQEMAASS